MLSVIIYLFIALLLPKVEPSDHEYHIDLTTGYIYKYNRKPFIAIVLPLQGITTKVSIFQVFLGSPWQQLNKSTRVIILTPCKLLVAMLTFGKLKHFRVPVRCPFDILALAE